MWPRAIAATFFCAYRGFPRVEARWRFRWCVLRRQNPLEGYRRLTYMMIDANVVACSPANTYRVLKAAGMLAGSTLVPSKKGTGVVQPLVPHEHWHVDISYINVAGTFLFLRGVLDGCSRYITHWEIREKMGETDVETILLKAREAHPGANPRSGRSAPDRLRGRPLADLDECGASNARLPRAIGISRPTTRAMPAPRINVGHTSLLFRR
jgi:transposase InsO family protein